MEAKKMPMMKKLEQETANTTFKFSPPFKFNMIKMPVVSATNSLRMARLPKNVSGLYDRRMENILNRTRNPSLNVLSLEELPVGRVL